MEVNIMPDFREIFTDVESTLRRESSLSPELFDERFGKFKNLSYTKMTDNEIFWTMVYVTFYSGMRAGTVSQKLPEIQKYLFNFEKVREYTKEDVDRIMNDPNVIRYRRKINACISNAREFKEVLEHYGTFSGYLQSFGGLSEKDAIERLRFDLRSRFKYLGERTVNHFLTDLGLNVLKPDRVVCRIFERLGLIDSRNNIDQAIEVGKRFASVTGHPIRYIDIIFVKYGQMGRDEYFGLEDGICLEKRPKCQICGVKEYCLYYAQSGGKEGVD
jgi:DNA-3-methyladenine glycosylase I